MNIMGSLNPNSSPQIQSCDVASLGHKTCFYGPFWGIQESLNVFKEKQPVSCQQARRYFVSCCPEDFMGSYSPLTRRGGDGELECHQSPWCCSWRPRGRTPGSPALLFPLQDFESNNELKTKVIVFLEEVMHDPELLTQERKAAANIIRYLSMMFESGIQICVLWIENNVFDWAGCDISLFYCLAGLLLRKIMVTIRSPSKMWPNL